MKFNGSAIIRLVAVSIISCASIVVAEIKDPTAASPEISRRLSLGTSAEKPNPTTATEFPDWKRLRIKAIVLRSRDHGSAIVSNGAERRFVYLRRSTSAKQTTHANTNQLKFQKNRFLIRGFTESSITLYHPKTRSQFTLK